MSKAPVPSVHYTWGYNFLVTRCHLRVVLQKVAPDVINRQCPWSDGEDKGAPAASLCLPMAALLLTAQSSSYSRFLWSFQVVTHVLHGLLQINTLCPLRVYVPLNASCQPDSFAPPGNIGAPSTTQSKTHREQKTTGRLPSSSYAVFQFILTEEETSASGV